MNIHESIFGLCLLMSFAIGVGLTGFMTRKFIPKILCLVLNDYRLQRMKHPTSLTAIMNNHLQVFNSKYQLEFNADKQKFEIKRIDRHH